MLRVLVLNGPNLNLLGEREQELYGTETLSEIMRRLQSAASERGAQITHIQSNSESELIEALHDAIGWADGVIINPAAYTHYSYAIRDAIEATDLPTVEVHLTDISAREPWRQVSVMEEVCIGQVMGQGGEGYVIALDLLLKYLAELD
jgi:3-dehydroquinate dehydratase-2